MDDLTTKSVLARSGAKQRAEDTRREALREIYEYVVSERGIPPEELTVGHVIDLLREEGIFFWRDGRFKPSQDVALLLAGVTRDGPISVKDREAATKVSLDYVDFVQFVSPLARIFLRAFSEDFIVPDWTTFVADMTYHFYNVHDNKEGHNAQYIPALRDADPEKWGLSICSIGGQRFSIGDYNAKFSIQSVSKPVTYALCLLAEGEEEVDRWIGVEPAGRPFNTQDLDVDTQNPFNASVNSGAIMAAGLFASRFPEATWEECVDKIRQTWSDLCGGDGHVGLSKETFESEKATAYNNFAIAYNLKGRRGLPRDVDLHKMLDVYLGCCSIEMTAEALAVAAATLANGGVCPITSKEVFPASVVRHVLSETMTCGMYDQAGRFCVEVGLPAKSGVSGALMVIVPNMFGIATFSPRLNKKGNSVRGLDFCKGLVNSYGVHVFEPLRSNNCGAKIDPSTNGRKDERVNVSQLVWAYQAGDVWATKLRNMFVHAMVQAAYATYGDLSDQTIKEIRCNYELIFQSELDDESLQRAITSVQKDPFDMSILEKLKGDRPVHDVFRSVLITAVARIVGGAETNEKGEEFVAKLLSLTGMDEEVAQMEISRVRQHIGHVFKNVEPCDVDTETLVSAVEDTLDVSKAEDDLPLDARQHANEVVRLRREVHRLQRRVARLTHMLHESRQQRTPRLSLIGSLHSINTTGLSSLDEDD